MRKKNKEVLYEYCVKLAKDSDPFELPLEPTAIKVVKCYQSYLIKLITTLVKEGRIFKVSSGLRGKPQRYSLKPVKALEGSPANLTDDDIQSIQIAPWSTDSEAEVGL